jgi:UDP-galactopyranose mutase
MPRDYDYLIVGAGFSGLTIAERLTVQLGARCLVVEKRGHIGGNAYDFFDDHGVLIHGYGPHYFRTNCDKVRDYLSRFTEWRPVAYKIKSFTDGRYWSFPINLNTFEQWIGRPSTTEEMEKWLEEKRVPIEAPANSEELIVSQVGWELYEKFFKGYMFKQWRRHPSELDSSVCGRIPIRTDRDDRYLSEKFQALPAEGYTRMFERMIQVCGSKLRLMLKTDYRDAVREVGFDRLIYTGPIDEFYDFWFGPLPYRSLRFEAESFGPDALKEREPIAGQTGFWQPAMQVNFPNSEDYTRIVEIKHATGQDCVNSTIVREYPKDYGPGKEPYYPVPMPDAVAQYGRYKALAQEGALPEILRKLNPKVTFLGRLAAYRYYNMDQVVGLALAEFERLRLA